MDNFLDFVAHIKDCINKSLLPYDVQVTHDKTGKATFLTLIKY